MELLHYPLKDFESMKYNVIKAEKNLLVTVPKLNNIKAFAISKASDIDELIKYVALMCDKGSPLILAGKDPKIKQAEAVTISGLKRLTLQTDDIIEMTIDYLKDQNELMWALLVANESTFWEYQQIISEPITEYKGDKDKISGAQLKTKLLGDCHDIMERVESYYTKLFSDAKIIEKVKSKALTPEMMAKKNA